MKIGFGRVDVTPPLGSPMAGYFTARWAEGVLDPLELCAIVVEEGEERIAVITADFLSMKEQDATGLRNLIAKEHGIPAQNVLMQCIHQHTAIFAGNMGGTSPDYKKMLERRYCDVVKLALNDLAEATVSTAEKETAEPVSFIRRFRMKNGEVRTNPGVGNPEIDHPLGEADNTVRLVRIHRETGDIALVGFQTHPDTVSGSKFSADWPGFVRRQMEKALEDEGVKCILVNGCQGDTNHINVNGAPRPKEVSEKYKLTRQMAQIITDAALSVWDKTTPSPAGALSGDFSIHVIPSNLDGIDRIDECKKLHRMILNKEPTPVPLNMAEKGEVRRIAGMENLPLFQKVPVSMVAFGKIAVVGYGGEPFTEYADVLREAYPELFILTACNCNGAQGYLPSEKAFEEGGYEARTTSFTKETPTVLQTEAKEKLARHQAKL